MSTIFSHLISFVNVVIILQDHGPVDESDIEIDGDDQPPWLSDEDLSRQTSSYVTENTEDSLAFDNRV